MLHKLVGGEVELCRRYVSKSPNGLRRCCIVDHPVYVYIADNLKSGLISSLLRLTGHQFLIPSTKANVFLGMPSPRRVSFLDLKMALTACCIDGVDIEVYGQKASVTTYDWLSQLPRTATALIDFGW